MSSSNTAIKTDEELIIGLITAISTNATLLVQMLNNYPDGKYTVAINKALEQLCHNASVDITNVLSNLKQANAVKEECPVNWHVAPTGAWWTKLRGYTLWVIPVEDAGTGAGWCWEVRVERYDILKQASHDKYKKATDAQNAVIAAINAYYTHSQE